MSELFLPFRNSPIRPVEEVRSTLILSGIQEIRARGHFSRYVDVLSPEMRERIFGLAAGMWVPVELAVAHYTAIDGLRLATSEIESIGADVANRTWKHILSPVAARAKRIGPKPWEALTHTHESIDLNWRGGDARIFRESPNQALYEWVGQPCAGIPYFVTSFGAFMGALIGLYSQRASHHIVPEGCTPTTISLRLSWIGADTEP
jgi:hypothetical protein